ncbi:MAG: hypothetical protein CEE42_06310 [Promethearchaeota archaeon Loki_b31]|nr:MAG: hypothetical protein CEE42_06310 [Candidatus Lokiarchaeota archaeon Loki_b31]
MNEDWFDYYDPLNESSLLEIEDDSIFLEWTLMEGSERINELSRQLHTFLNYKFALIRQRYSKSPANNKKTKNDMYIKYSKDLSDLISEYLLLIKIIGASEDNLAQKIQDIMQKAKLHASDFEIEILKKIKLLGGSIWKEIHILSEIEYDNSILLKVVFKTAKLLCNAESAFYFPFSNFYRELEKNYLELDYEISSLLYTNIEEQYDVKSSQPKVKILE